MAKNVLKDIISYSEYQKLSDADKQNYETKWNADGKSGIATRKGAKLPKVKPTVPTSDMKQADPNAKTSEKVRDKAHLAELENSYKNGYYDEKTNEFHYNPKYVEQRSADAKEDAELGRDYRTAKAPSQAQLDKRNGTFDRKGTDGKFVYSYSELVKMRDEARSNGDTELVAKIQKEINGRPEGQAEIKAKQKAAAETEAPKGTTVTAGKGGDNAEGDASILDDTSTQDKALDTKEAALDKVLDDAKLRRDELSKEWDALLDKNEKELDKHKDAADLAEFLPKFAIAHYLRGDFGKKGSADAIGTLGYFLLDKIGTSIVNASLVARGMNPSQTSMLQKYNEKMMDTAIARDDKNRAKINEEKINNVIKNSDALREAGYASEVKLGNDMASKYLSQHADQVDEQAYLQLKKQAASWYNKLTDDDKMMVDRLMLAMSANPNERQKSILKYQLLNYEAGAEEDKKRKADALYGQIIIKNQAALSDKEVAKATAVIDQIVAATGVSKAQEADIWKQVSLHQKDIDWYDAKATQQQIAGYANTVINGVGAVMP
jgi:hypothetical protein